MRIEDILARFEGVKRNGSGWMARCSAHDDRHPSLSITEEQDGTKLLNCHAGCKTDDVIAAARLTWADLFPDEQSSWTPPPRRRERSDPTADEQRLLERQALYVRALEQNPLVRQRLHERRGWTDEAMGRLGIGYDPDAEEKRVVTFPVERDGVLRGHVHYTPAPRDGVRKAKADAGVPRELFPAPETITTSGWLFLHEGEPDVVLMNSLGATAVGVPGVKGWKTSDPKRFAGRDIAILVDTDAEGRALGERLRADLLPHVRRLAVLDLAEIAEAIAAIEGAKDVTEAALALPEADRAGFGKYLHDLAEMTAEAQAEDVATKATEATKGGASVASVASVATLEPPGPAAFSGLGGRYVRAIEPHTEAAPVALLGSVLAGFGNAVGRRPHVMVGRQRHGANLFVTLVGDSSHSRKGSSWSDARWLLGEADADWLGRVRPGLVSGEGLIHAVRDPVKKLVTDEHGDETEKEVDPGELDRRLFCVEPEYGRVLTAGARQGSTLIHTLRAAWDGDRLGNLTRKDAESATDAHISVLGHITSAELLRDLSETDRANGFANRVIWLFVARSKELAFPGSMSAAESQALVDELATALDRARRIDEVEWSPDAQALWREHYHHLTRDRPGLTGAIVSRAEAQVLRLALIYALLDCSTWIAAEHLESALALWDYAERSVGAIFGGLLGDPTADAILTKLRRSPEGITRTEIRDLFGRHVKAIAIEQALGALEAEGLASKETQETGGRPAERWRGLEPDGSSEP